MWLEIKQLTRLQIIRYCEKLEKENKKLKEDNRFLTKISKEYMKKENIVKVTEFTELYKDDLEQENQTLKDKIDFLTSCLDDRDKGIELMEEENETNTWLIKYWKAQYEEQKKELKSKDELIRYYKKKVKDLKTEIGKLVKWE